MHIIIIGAGEVGGYLARILVEEGHEIAIVELDDARARELDASLDALVIAGSGVSRAALLRAGLATADLVMAVTAVDEVNLIACMIAGKHGRAGVRTVARARRLDYLASDGPLGADELGIDLVIGPERAVATDVLQMLRYVGPGELQQLAGGRFVLVGLLCGPDSPLIHEPIAAMRQDLPRQSLIAAIQGKRGLRVPRGDDRLAADERAFVLTTPDDVQEFAILSGRPWHRVRNVLVVGCGDIGFAVARELDRQGLRPTVVEVDRARAEWAASRLSDAVVLHADGSDPDVLRERLEQDDVDALVVLIDDDARSLLTGVFARSLGARKTICRCDNPAYAHVANQLGIDALISPNRAVANAILRYVQRGQIESTLMLGDHEGEILELRVPAAPRRRDIVRRPLRELAFPAGALIGGVIRSGAACVADGDTVLQPGDDLLVFTLARALHDVEAWLAAE